MVKIVESQVVNKIFNEDILTYLKRLPDRSVDLFVLDPPYYRVVGDKWDNQWFTLEEYIEWCYSWIKEIERTSKWSASLWIFGFPHQLLHTFPVLQKNDFTFRQQIVVNKGMQAIAGRTSNKLKMFPTATESIFFFHKDARNHIRGILQSERKRLGMKGNDVNGYLGKAITGGGAFACMASEKKPREHRVYPTREDWTKLSEIMHLPPYDDMVYSFNIIKGLTDVWDDINFYDRKVKKIHSTQKPLSLIDRIVLASSYENDLVVDPFMGSGTTAMSCINNNRRYSGCEIDEDYYKNASQRIAVNNLDAFF